MSSMLGESPVSSPPSRVRAGCSCCSPWAPSNRSSETYEYAWEGTRPATGPPSPSSKLLSRAGALGGRSGCGKDGTRGGRAAVIDSRPSVSLSSTSPGPAPHELSCLPIAGGGIAAMEGEPTPPPLPPPPLLPSPPDDRGSPWDGARSMASTSAATGDSAAGLPSCGSSKTGDAAVAEASGCKSCGSALPPCGGGAAGDRQAREGAVSAIIMSSSITMHSCLRRPLPPPGGLDRACLGQDPSPPSHSLRFVTNCVMRVW